jgi:hypothetical protein
MIYIQYYEFGCLAMRSTDVVIDCQPSPGTAHNGHAQHTLSLRTLYRRDRHLRRRRAVARVLVRQLRRRRAVLTRRRRRQRVVVGSNLRRLAVQLRGRARVPAITGRERGRLVVITAGDGAARGGTVPARRCVTTTRDTRRVALTLMQQRRCVQCGRSHTQHIQTHITITSLTRRSELYRIFARRHPL